MKVRDCKSGVWVYTLQLVCGEVKLFWISRKTCVMVFACLFSFGMKKAPNSGSGIFSEDILAVPNFLYTFAAG